MSNKRKLPIILGTCAATVLAAGGTIFLTDTALSLLDRQTQNVRGVQTEQEPKETELPITVEQFAKTDDSFEILASGGAGTDNTPETESGDRTDDTDQLENRDTEDQTEDGGMSANEAGGSSQTGGTASRTENNGTQTGNTASQTESTEAETEDTTPQTERIMPGTMYARSDVYVRSSAGTDGEILGVVSEGEGVMATGSKLGNWIEVSYGGKTGYVGGSYLTTEGGNESGNGTSGNSTGSGSGTSGNSTGSGSGTSGSSTGSGSGTSGSSTGSGNGTSGNSTGSGSGTSGNSTGSGNGTSGNSTGSGSGSSGSSTGSGSGTSDGSAGNSDSAIIPVNGTMYATAGVNVRTGPGSDYSRIGAVNTGENIGVTGDTYGDWTEVIYDGQRGYIYSKYLVWDPEELSSGGSSGSDNTGNSGAWDDSYIYDVSSYYCDESEFDGWSATDLAYLRNEIFARHGRIFDSEKYREYFSQKTWYNPTYEPSYFDANLDSFLNDYEWANLKLIQKLEDARY